MRIGLTDRMVFKSSSWRSGELRAAAGLKDDILIREALAYQHLFESLEE
jgi:hypothetical protein